MKTLNVMIAFFTVVTLNACAQNEKTPTNVINAFNQKFPEAKSIKWDRENKHEWEAEFKIDHKQYSANFSNEGKWKETEYKIDPSDLPAKVKVTLDTKFKGYDVEYAEVSETAEHTVYEFSMEKDDSDFEVVIDKLGKVVQKEEKGEGNENGENDEDGEENE